MERFRQPNLQVPWQVFHVHQVHGAGLQCRYMRRLVAVSLEQPAYRLFQFMSGQAAAVERDERLAPSITFVVNQPRKVLLSRPGFAVQQQGGIRLPGQPDLLQHTSHGLASADERLDGVGLTQCNPQSPQFRVKLRCRRRVGCPGRLADGRDDAQDAGHAAVLGVQGEEMEKARQRLPLTIRQIGRHAHFSSGEHFRWRAQTAGQ